MKILFLSDNFPPEVSASASRVYERAVYWAKWGHDVTVITCAPNFPKGRVYPGYKNKWYQTEIMDGIKVVRVKTFMAENSGFLFRILDYLSFMIAAVGGSLFQKKPDVVIATSPQFFTAIAGYAVSILKWRPFVFEISDLWPESIRAVGAIKNNYLYNLIEKIELFLYRRSKKVIAQTPAFKHNLVSRGIYADKIDVILNGVNIDFFKPQVVDLSTKLTLGSKEGEFVVGYVGNHGMAQGLDLVMQAAEKLQDAKDIRFVFVGEGAKKQELIKFKEEKKLSNVVFNSAFKKSEMPSVWSVCDIVLIPLKNDITFSTVIPSKLFEAMSMGKAVILVSPKGMASQIVKKHDFGVHIDSYDVGQLIQIIKQMHMDTALREKFSYNASISAKEYSREAQASNFMGSINCSSVDHANNEI